MSARNAESMGNSKFFGSIKSQPGSPQENISRTQLESIMRPFTPASKNQTLFKKFTGGIFDDESDYMSQKLFNPYESTLS